MSDELSPEDLAADLSKPELVELAELYGVDVAKSKTKPEIAEAIVEQAPVSDEEEDSRALLLAARESVSSKAESKPRTSYARQAVPERVDPRRYLRVEDEAGAFGNTHNQSPVLDRAKHVDKVFAVRPPKGPEPDITSPRAVPSIVRRYPIPGNPAKS